jgi:hypothetical protein
LRFINILEEEKLNKQELDYSVEKLNVTDRMKFLENGKH